MSKRHFLKYGDNIYKYICPIYFRFSNKAKYLIDSYQPNIPYYFDYFESNSQHPNKIIVMTYDMRDTEIKTSCKETRHENESYLRFIMTDQIKIDCILSGQTKIDDINFWQNNTDHFGRLQFISNNKIMMLKYYWIYFDQEFV